MSLVGDCDKTRLFHSDSLMDSLILAAIVNSVTCVQRLYLKDITFTQRTDHVSLYTCIFHNYHFVTYNQYIYQEHAHIKHH